MPKLATFESFAGALAHNDDPTVTSHHVERPAETAPDTEPFGTELFTTIKAPELRLGSVACALSRTTQVDDWTGAQDNMNLTSPLVVDTSEEVRSLN